jgi:alkanesulfonate monooxygenase SsuD/methylene tetrahydromethanopterin reductase-like flavin-dependent oxidoreductase (luciferase family)
MLLGYSLTPFGHQPDAWRQAPDGRLLGFDALLDQVSAAETAGFDFVLLADRRGLRPVDDLSSVAVPFEPTLLASALASRAGRIGIVAAAATVQHEPYNLARRFASLDLISKGRAGWLVVPDDSNPDRESEYVDVVTTLWDSFEDDAFLYDKAAGRFFDPLKMHVAHHKGAHFSVRGPLNVNRSPQGRPVVAHLLDDRDDALAVRTGELFLLQARSVEDLVAALDRTHKAVEAAGRRRGDIRILASISPVISSATHETNAVSVLSDDDPTTQALVATRLIGSAPMIVEQLQELKDAADLDGFTILPPTLEMGQRFFAEVIPELRLRRLIAQSSGATLRDRLGLAWPEHPQSPPKVVSA